MNSLAQLLGQLGVLNSKSDAAERLRRARASVMEGCDGALVGAV
jgi:hypothetical protein